MRKFMTEVNIFVYRHAERYFTQCSPNCSGELRYKKTGLYRNLFEVKQFSCQSAQANWLEIASHVELAVSKRTPMRMSLHIFRSVTGSLLK